MRELHRARIQEIGDGVWHEKYVLSTHTNDTLPKRYVRKTKIRLTKKQNANSKRNTYVYLRHFERCQSVSGDSENWELVRMIYT